MLGARITGNLGAGHVFDGITAAEIGKIAIGGVCSSDIVRQAVEDFAIQQIDAGSFEAGRIVRNPNGSIGSIRALSGDIAADIQADGANSTIGTVESLAGNVTGRVDAGKAIDFIFARNGTIGTTSIRSTLKIRSGGSQREIGRVVARSINAVIETPSDIANLSMQGSIGTIQCTQGDFSGSISSYRLGTLSNQPGLSIAGSFTGKLTITGMLNSAPNMGLPNVITGSVAPDTSVIGTPITIASISGSVLNIGGLSGSGPRIIEIGQIDSTGALRIMSDDMIA